MDKTTKCAKSFNVELITRPVDWIERIKLDSHSLWHNDELIQYLGNSAVEQLCSCYIQATKRRMKEIQKDYNHWTSNQMESFYSQYIKRFSDIIDAMILKKKQEWLEQAIEQYMPYFLNPLTTSKDVHNFTYLLSQLYSQSQGIDVVFALLKQRPDLFIVALGQARQFL